MNNLNDFYRTAYHFQPASGFIGDPLSFFWKGEYHVFFQYHPYTGKDWNPWLQAMSLPRIVSVSSAGHLAVEPVPELKSLRGDHVHLEGLQVAADPSTPKGEVRFLEGVGGNAVEIVARIQPREAGIFGLFVCCAADMSEYTRIALDLTSRQLRLDNFSSGQETGQSQDGYNQVPLSFNSGEEVDLHLFIDHSIVEIFTGRGGTSLTWRVYPSDPDNDRVGIFVARGRVEVESIDAWLLG